MIQRNKEFRVLKNNQIQDLAELGVDDLTKGYGEGRFSPVDATRAALARIEAFNDQVNAFCLVDAKAALAAAAESEKRWQEGHPLGPIDGVPTSIKDTVQARGWTSTMGSNVFTMTGPSKTDGSVTARLREAGAVLLGLTCSPEIGWKGVTDSPRHGVTRNPWDTARTPGGSSGGAAAAAALGMGCLHVGTDAGGSIRIPAAFSGVFGHKPSFGRVPNTPPSPFSTLSHTGPITRNVRDAALMLDVLASPDPTDWYSLPPISGTFADALDGGIKGLRIAWSPSLGGNLLDPQLATTLATAMKDLAALGGEFIEAEPDMSDAREIFEAFWFAAVAWRLDGLSEAELDALDPGLRALQARTGRLTLLEYQEQAQQRMALAARLNSFMEDYDLLITPTLPITAFEAGRDVPATGPYTDWWDWAAFCYPFNLTRLPAASIPCGQVNGLPVGLQIVGRRFDDATVLRAAHALESQRPPAFPQHPRPASAAGH
ncbi:MAG TPA: amidase [Gammaproteobacteria bacterium]|nr:amidase [Gammaproteobacteria bacterium]